MKPPLSLRIDLTEGGPSSDPIQYSVVGFVEGGVVLITRNARAWKLLRLKAGGGGLEGGDGFPSPEAALAFLQAESFAAGSATS